MRLYARIISLLIFLFVLIVARAQNPRLVLTEDGSPIDKPVGFFATTENLFVGSQQSISDELRAFWHIQSNGTITEVPLENQQWNIVVPEFEFGSRLLYNYAVSAGSDVYFIHSFPVPNRLIKFSDESGWETVYSGSLDKRLVKHDNKLRITPTTFNTPIDTGFVDVDLQTGSKSYRISSGRMRTDNSKGAIFKNQPVGNLRNEGFTNHIDDDAGFVQFNANTEEFTHLLPQAMQDSIDGSEVFGTVYQVFPTDSLLFFIHHYGSPDYHEQALFVSRGVEHDAQKLQVLWSRHFANGQGSDRYADDLIVPQDYLWHNGYLYYIAYPHPFERYLFRTNGEEVHQVIEEPVIPSQVGKGFNRALRGDSLFVLTEGSESTNVLVGLDLTTLSYSTTETGHSTPIQSFRVLRDTLWLVSTQPENPAQANHRISLYQPRDKKITHVFEGYANTTITGTGAALIGNQLYFAAITQTGNQLFVYDLQPNTTGITAQATLDWKAQPNPTHNHFYIQAPEYIGETVGFQLFDVRGKQVGYGTQPLSQPISMDEFSPGVYLLKLHQQNRVIGHVKIVKQ